MTDKSKFTQDLEKLGDDHLKTVTERVAAENERRFGSQAPKLGAMTPAEFERYKAEQGI